MKLTDELQETIVFQEKEILVNLDFHVVLLLFELLEEKHLAKWQKLDTALYLLIGEHSYDILQAEAILNLITNELLNETGVATGPKLDITGEPMPQTSEESEEAYDFTIDAALIYASFMQAYQMDLFEMKGKLHWYKFKALLAGLPHDTSLMQVIEIRQKELPTGKGTEEQRRKLIELKKRYKLPKKE